MRALVTGGAGFIGSNIVEGLVEKGWDVTVLDNFFLGTKENLQNVVHKIHLVGGDVLDVDLVNRMVDGQDYVFHIAAHSSAPMFDEDPRPGANVNILGFLNVLEAARRAKTKKVVYASTSSMYGSLRPPHKEEMRVTPPNFYSATKLARENFARLYSEIHGLPTVGLRFFSIYGPHESGKGRYANIVTQFLWSMKQGKHPVIYGDGKQTRDFTYVKDAVELALLAATKPVKCDVFNAGTGKAYSFLDIVAKWNEILGTKIKPEIVRNPVNNYVANTRADISKAKKILGYKPRYSLESGMAETLKAY